MTSAYHEEHFTTTLWNYFPGIIKILSVVGVIISLFTVFNTLIDSTTNASDVYSFDPNLARSYNYKFGNENSKVKYIYFVDFQCPACAGNNNNFKQIKEEYKDKVYFIYKHNPLTQIHTNAKQAAIAVQAASEQGKFIEFGEELFANQNSLGSDSLERYAQKIGLDIPRWKSDISNKKIMNYVSYDQKDLDNTFLETSSVSGASKPVGEGAGTPTSILMKDGKIIDWWTGGQEVATVKTKLDDLLK